MTDKLNQGDELYLVDVTRWYDKSTKETQGCPVRVSYRGTKYFEVERLTKEGFNPRHNTRFRLKDMTQDAAGYTRRYKVYFSRGHYLEELETQEVAYRLTNYVRQGSLYRKHTLEELKAVADILKPEED
jgi:hypothetical protein